MATRRCFQTLTRCLQSINQTLAATPPNYIFVNNFNVCQRAAVPTRSFCSKHTGSDDDDEEEEEEEDYESEEEEEDNENEMRAVLSAEEKEKEAAEIGYTVLGPLQKSDRVFKLYEPVFAVVQIGSHQFKVSNGDTIYTERLKHCDVNDKLVLNKVLMLGSQTQTIIGRPILPDAAVHAVVEEHVSEWMKSRGVYTFTPVEHAVQLDLIGKVHGFLQAESYFNSLTEQDKTDKKPQIRTRTRPSRKSPIFESLYRSIAHLGDPNVSVVPALDEWIRQGNSAKKWDLQRVITELMTSKRFRHALEVSLWMSNGKRYPISPFDIGVRLKLILKNFSIEQAENYFNKIPEDLKTYQIYLALLNCYTISKSVDKAESVMQKAKDLGYADKPIWYNLMMNLYYQLGNREKLRVLLAEMESKGVSYDQFTYSVCLSACAMTSDAVGMDWVVRIMESDPAVAVHWRTLVTAAQGYLRIGSTDEVMEVLKKLEKQLKTCSQRNVLLVFLLDLYAEAGKKEELYRIWKTSKDGKVINKVYISMMRSLMKFNDIEGMEKILEEWESGASLFDFRVPNFLIDAYCTISRVERAEALIAEVVSKGGSPLVTTWCHLAGGYMKKNQVPQAVRSLRKAISACPPKFMSQKHSLMTCLEYLQNNECVEEAEELIKSLRMRGVSEPPTSDEFGSFKKDAREDQDFEGILASEDEDIND